MGGASIAISIDAIVTLLVVGYKLAILVVQAIFLLAVPLFLGLDSQELDRLEAYLDEASSHGLWAMVLLISSGWGTCNRDQQPWANKHFFLLSGSSFFSYSPDSSRLGIRSSSNMGNLSSALEPMD